MLKKTNILLRGRLRQENLEFKPSLGYVETLSQNKTTRKTNILFQYWFVSDSVLCTSGSPAVK
jgi:hypothetical protein